MKYIPQAPPFLMIDELLDSNGIETITRFLIQKGHLFEENNKFTEPGLIENMAQSAATGMGFKTKTQDKLPKIGFIGQIKNLEIYKLPNVGETIITKVTTQNKIGNAQIIEGLIKCEKEMIARGIFMVFLQE